MISPIEENEDFRGFADVANIRKPKQDRGAMQPIAKDVSPELEAELEKIRPGFKQWRAQQLAQEAQADGLRSQAQHPEADGVGQQFGFKPVDFLSDDPEERAQGISQMNHQLSGERDIKQAEMSPKNITPGAKPVGKGGVIADPQMNVGAVGHQIGAPGSGTTDNKVSGRQEFYRMRKFYGR